MEDDAEDEGVKPSATGHAAALAVALGGTTPEAREYLRAQSRLTDMQIDQLEKSERFEVSHLHFRRFTDVGKLALQLAVGLVVLLAVCGLGTMVWSAAHARGMVVEAFAVPPDMAQTGLTGSVLANRLIDRFGQLQSSSIAINQGTTSFRRDSANAIRVEIPETGVSIAELDRMLREWLGHENHVSGELVRETKGYSLTVRYGDRPGATVTGTDIDALMKQGAEQLMAAALPYRYVEYLARGHRVTEALALLPVLAANPDHHEQTRAFAAWSALYSRMGDTWDAANKAYEGLRLAPGNVILEAWLSTAEGNLEHEEASLAASAMVPSQLDSKSAADMAPQVVAAMPILLHIYHEDFLGNYPAALAGWTQLSRMTDGAYDPGQRAIDAVLGHDLALARNIYRGIDKKPVQDGLGTSAAQAGMMIGLAAQGWAGAALLGQQTDVDVKRQPRLAWSRKFYVPVWAMALARQGDFAGARKLVAALPSDCDFCVRTLGDIAALEGDWAGATRWFAIVSARTQHIPMADTDWGAMLLRKGDADGAILKFQSAHAKGPSFADPLEMWGEALMAKNQSHLALAKFAAAEKTAPHWGRLHLKWGEALVYAGREGEAQKQFALARDLTPAQQGELHWAGRALGT